MSHNLDDFLATKTCEAGGEYVKITTDPSTDEIPTTPVESGAQTRRVTVDAHSQSVVIYYDAAEEHNLAVRKKISELLKGE